MNLLFDLTGKTAIVTGADTGLGQGMAIGLARAGADIVAVSYVDCTDTVQKIKELKRNVLEIKSDLSDINNVKNVVNKTIQSLDKVDILINNAGIIRRTPAIDFTEKNWDDVMQINSKTVFFMAQAAARDMMKRNRGKIINIASLLSFQGGITVPSYAASKGAVAQITKALANEWAKYNININAIAPGYMATNNTKALREDEVRNKAILDRIPAGRWGTPDDLMGAAIFLASDASNYINGHVLVVDGGWMAR